LPYRCEWRYGIWAHRVAVIDAGHVSQNLYLACVALGLGTCAIAAFDMAVCDALFGLDGEEEFTVYASPVGTISPADQKSEKAFYQFVEDEGL
jgi:SagB-type dehydrogenase family enzyme